MECCRPRESEPFQNFDTMTSRSMPFRHVSYRGSSAKCNATRGYVRSVNDIGPASNREFYFKYPCIVNVAASLLLRVTKPHLCYFSFILTTAAAAAAAAASLLTTSRLKRGNERKGMYLRDILFTSLRKQFSLSLSLSV